MAKFLDSPLYTLITYFTKKYDRTEHFRQVRYFTIHNKTNDQKIRTLPQATLTIYNLVKKSHFTHHVFSFWVHHYQMCVFHEQTIEYHFIHMSLADLEKKITFESFWDTVPSVSSTILFNDMGMIFFLSDYRQVTYISVQQSEFALYKMS